jgi:hypothetical protein
MRLRLKDQGNFSLNLEAFTVRALLRIRLPSRMVGVKALHGIRMKNTRDRNPSLHEPVPGDATTLAAPR